MALKRLLSTALFAALVAVTTAGCATVPGTAQPATYEELRQEEGWTLLDAVPFVEQHSGEDCGAASLSMVLAHWGVDAPAETLAQECAVAGEPGLRASALRDAARRRGLSAYLFAGRVADLEHELGRGRPVVVGLLRSEGLLSATHFEVVVGVHPRAQRIAALDPAVGLVADALPAFAGEWAATEGVTLVVFRPGTTPGPQASSGR